MQAQVSPEILERVDALAVKLGVTVSHLWGVLIRQAYLTWVDVGLWLLALVVVASASYLFLRKAVSAKHEYDGEPWAIAAGISGVVGGILLIVAIVCLSTAINATLNPEYFALKEILKAVAP